MGKICKFIRILFAAVFIVPFFVLGILGILFYWLFTFLGMKRTAETVSHFFYYILCWWIIFFLGARVHVKGRENIPPKDESVVFAPNHNSLIDVPLFYAVLGRFPAMMAKKELFVVPIIHGCLVSLKCIRIDRKGAHSIVEAVRSGCKTIEEGHSLVVFPEGTRSRTGEIGTFKNGAFKIAQRTGAAVVPVAIRNDRYLLESAHTLTPVDVYITFLPKVETSSLSEEEQKDLASCVEGCVRREWETLPSYDK